MTAVNEEGHAESVPASIASASEETHPLQSTWSLWYTRKGPSTKTIEYEKSIKLLGSFSTVEGFWSLYSHLVRPNDSPNSSDYHIFRQGIKPMWEDEANRHGGKWIVRLRKGLASRAWEELLLALIGEQFGFGNDICGAVVSLRFQEDIIAVWNRNAEDKDGAGRIRDTLKHILYMFGPSVQFEYKAHDASLKDNSSFRNTSTDVAVLNS